ncbi:hypothetical protein B0I35DRAFT_78407 [Stachybotrys elegans]|uniref:NACHT-NTPase and P-loop NTPases N-terminal domain-containing protein n=1 Tax=Stachybotrys elegans TaxID=80388 RepID=A0A8K0WMF1_9HYPO|nr:hypothetical protein B0I35DRAFT_78407 [Stachybotrys elegans]
MSGVELVGLISGIITLIEASIKIYKIADNSSGLPPSFHDVASRLPLIQDTLTLASHGISTDSASSPSSDALKKVLLACAERAAALHETFQVAVPRAGTTLSGRYLSALKTVPKAGKVEELMTGITRDLQVLTANRAVQAPTRAEITELIRELQAMTLAQKGFPGPSVVLRNLGSGSQYHYGGVGNQNLASDGATQINGDIHGGTFNIIQK